LAIDIGSIYGDPMVLLNFLGVERTTTEREVRYVGDIHLSFMPFSHSILTMIGVALLAWLVLGKGLVCQVQDGVASASCPILFLT